MHAPTPSLAYTCPNCGGVVEINALQCGSCRADFSAPGAWKPLRNGLELEVEPGAFVLFCFIIGLAFLTYLSSVLVFGTWDAVRGAQALGTSLLWAYFRFNLLELLPFAVLAFGLSIVLLRSARLPKAQWAAGVFGWATVFLGIFLLAMLSLGIMAIVIAPFLLAPAVLLYGVGSVLVCIRLAARRANLSHTSRTSAAAT